MIYLCIPAQQAVKTSQHFKLGMKLTTHAHKSVQWSEEMNFWAGFFLLFLRLVFSKPHGVSVPALTGQLSGELNARTDWVL